MTEARGIAPGRRLWIVAVLVLVVGLAVTVGPAWASPLQETPAEQQYGQEAPPATSAPDVEEEPGVFLPPTVASGQEDSGGLLPLTGAALIVPSVLGGILLVGGLALVYRTRRRED
jgi:LPXTG-motif cell wall-anchored protein